jgi:hypothetical protein
MTYVFLCIVVGTLEWDCIQCTPLLVLAKDRQNLKLDESVLLRVWSIGRGGQGIGYRFCLSGKQALQTHHPLIINTE